MASKSVYYNLEMIRGYYSPTCQISIFGLYLSKCSFRFTIVNFKRKELPLSLPSVYSLDLFRVETKFVIYFIITQKKDAHKVYYLELGEYSELLSFLNGQILFSNKEQKT